MCQVLFVCQSLYRGPVLFIQAALPVNLTLSMTGAQMHGTTQEVCVKVQFVHNFLYRLFYLYSQLFLSIQLF